MAGVLRRKTQGLVRAAHACVERWSASASTSTCESAEGFLQRQVNVGGVRCLPETAAGSTAAGNMQSLVRQCAHTGTGTRVRHDYRARMRADELAGAGMGHKTLKAMVVRYPYPVQVSLLQPQGASCTMHGCTPPGAHVPLLAPRMPTLLPLPERSQPHTPRKMYVYNLKKEIVDKVELPGDVFNVPVRLDILQVSCALPLCLPDTAAPIRTRASDTTAPPRPGRKP